MDKRIDKRTRRRIPCELRIEGQIHAGIVLDLSSTGVFVQTARLPGPGEAIEVRIPRLEHEGEALWLPCRVARQRRVPSRLVSVAAGGLGLKLLETPPAYRELLQVLRCEREAEAPPATPPDLRPLFRVRASQIGGPRSRTLELRGADAVAARRDALERLGCGWQVLEVTALDSRS